MLKFVIVGLIFTTVSSGPLGSTTEEKPTDSHTKYELVRPSPINPDIPMDPKPPERIYLDDSKPERNRKSLEKKPYDGDESHSNLKNLKRGSKNNQEKNLPNDKLTEESNDNLNGKKNSVRIENSDDDEKAGTTTPNLKAGQLIQPLKSDDEPPALHAVKAEEKQRSESFQTSHRIPNVEEGERKFETSHHIPSHIENERTKLIENPKVRQKASN